MLRSGSPLMPRGQDTRGKALPRLSSKIARPWVVGRFSRLTLLPFNPSVPPFSLPPGDHRSKGEKGENSPMYRYFEMLSRAKKPVPGMGPVPPLYNYEMLVLFWEVLFQFGTYRDHIAAFFGVSKDGVPG